VRFWELFLSYSSVPFSSLSLPQPPVTQAVGQQGFLSFSKCGQLCKTFCFAECLLHFSQPFSYWQCCSIGSSVMQSFGFFGERHVPIFRGSLVGSLNRIEGCFGLSLQ
jgi:hypothetical protein